MPKGSIGDLCTKLTLNQRSSFGAAKAILSTEAYFPIIRLIRQWPASVPPFLRLLNVLLAGLLVDLPGSSDSDVVGVEKTGSIRNLSRSSEQVN